MAFASGDDYDCGFKRGLPNGRGTDVWIDDQPTQVGKLIRKWQ